MGICGISLFLTGNIPDVVSKYLSFQQGAWETASTHGDSRWGEALTYLVPEYYLCFWILVTQGHVAGALCLSIQYRCISCPLSSHSFNR